MTQAEAQPPMISRRRLLGLGIVAAAAGLTGWQVYTRAPDYAGQSLSVADAHAAAKAGDITLIDIRRPDEWARTGIGEGAHPIDMRRDDFTAELERIAGANKSAPIALICARGVRSARLSNQLTEAGYSRIIDVPEGMLGSGAGPGWIQRGLPVRAYRETSG